MQNRKVKRFQKIEKIIQLQQKNIGIKLTEINNLIGKKDRALSIVKKYLLEYEMEFDKLHDVYASNLQNFQAFLRQIITVINREHESIEHLKLKSSGLFAEYVSADKRIEVIKEMLKDEYGK